jgi:hypothetical protein
MKWITILIIIFLSTSCREFYDEEFDEANASTSELLNRTYNAELVATDGSITQLAGQSEVVVKDGNVEVNLEVTGIPANILQVHYSFIASDCTALAVVIPNEVGETRSVNISENSSIDSLVFDLRSSGAIPSDGSVDLEGKSFVVKAFNNFSGLSNATGTNPLTIACGRLEVGPGVEATTPDEEPVEAQ